MQEQIHALVLCGLGRHRNVTCGLPQMKPASATTDCGDARGELREIAGSARTPFCNDRTCRFQGLRDCASPGALFQQTLFCLLGASQQSLSCLFVALFLLFRFYVYVLRVRSGVNPTRRRSTNACNPVGELTRNKGETDSCTFFKTH